MALGTQQSVAGPHHGPARAGYTMALDQEGPGMQGKKGNIIDITNLAGHMPKFFSTNLVTNIMQEERPANITRGAYKGRACLYGDHLCPIIRQIFHCTVLIFLEFFLPLPLTRSPGIALQPSHDPREPCAHLRLCIL